MLNSTYSTLWVLIAETGGHVTDGYDSTVVDPSRPPLYGAYGPFSGVTRQGERSTRPSLRAGTQANVIGCGYPGNPPCSWTGVVKYWNYDLQQLVPLPFAYVTAFCGRLQYPPYSYVGFQGPVNANGSFSMTCNQGFERMSFNVGFYDLVNVEVRGKNGVGAGGSAGYFLDGGTVEFHVINDYAAHVFSILRESIPRAVSMFGRSRSVTQVYVNNQDTTGGINYNTGDDIIRTNLTRVFTQDGHFVTNHEYGHAFQYKAIENWTGYACTNNQHSISVPNQLSCAFVEGFADFFSGWVGGPTLTVGWTNGYLTDNALEVNPWLALGDGSRIEGPVASFFYDLVDGANEPDGPNNTPDGDESFDTATFPGSYVSDLLSTCGFPFVTKLSGIDQFIYCAERSLEAYSLGTSWRSYGSFSESATEPPGWSKDLVRLLWRYNLYNVGP